MFFFGLIVSVTDREHVLADGLGRLCPSCGRTTPHRLIEVYRQLALFFIPTWRWNRRNFLVCDVCGQVQSLAPEESEELRGGGGST